jgi:hypothetical protein
MRPAVSVKEALFLGLATFAFVIPMTWWVLRPFERERKRRRAKQHAAE